MRRDGSSRDIGRVMLFKPSAVLKAHINGEDSDGED
jgi:hypothetical protein